MSVQIVQFRADPRQVQEVEEAIRQLIAAVAEVAPPGIEYVASRVGDSSEFLLSLTLPDDAGNPLLEIPDAVAFRGRVSEWAGGPVSPSPLHVVARYPHG